jgi:hypothetical protein
MVTLRFTPPQNYNLAFYEIGETDIQDGPLSGVASGTDIGLYPYWIDTINYTSGNPSNWYAVRFGTDTNDYTAWSPRMYGKYGVDEHGYFVFNPSGSPWVYLIPPQMSEVIPDWLNYNYEYTVKIDASGLYGSGMNYMESDFTFTFQVVTCPSWSTVDAVRLAVGPFIDSLPDDTINKMILRASMQAMSRFYMGTNPYGCSYLSVPEPVFRWVTCMAGMFTLNTILSNQNTNKRLGAFDVSYGVRPGSISPSEVRKSLDDCLKESAISIQALDGTLLAFATKSLHNNMLRHPQADPQWGRHPRKVDLFVHGPWRRAFNDIKLFYSNYMRSPYDYGLQRKVEGSNLPPGTMF